MLADGPAGDDEWAATQSSVVSYPGWASPAGLSASHHVGSLATGAEDAPEATAPGRRIDAKPQSSMGSAASPEYPRLILAGGLKVAGNRKALPNEPRRESSLLKSACSIGVFELRKRLQGYPSWRRGVTFSCPTTRSSATLSSSGDGKRATKLKARYLEWRLPSCHLAGIELAKLRRSPPTVGNCFGSRFGGDPKSCR